MEETGEHIQLTPFFKYRYYRNTDGLPGVQFFVDRCGGEGKWAATFIHWSRLERLSDSLRRMGVAIEKNAVGKKGDQDAESTEGKTEGA